MSQVNASMLGMSDDDFLKLNQPEGNAIAQGETSEPSSSATTTPAEEPVGDAGDSEPVVADPNAGGAGDASTGDAESTTPEGGEAGTGGENTTSTAPVPGSTPDGAEPKPTTTGETPSGDKKDPAATTAAEEPKEAPVDHKAFYEALINKPINANGKQITLRTPEEVIRMVQMGAGYGRKIQEIQPHLKTLRMLEKNNLLDENQLSYLIDLHQKNPDAIKKLIKESGIDPLDLNIGDNAQYTPGNHAVSDEEIRFRDALEEVQQNPSGKETIRLINTTWDQTSKNMLWKSPEVLSVIQTQRDNKVYDLIVEEMDRQKLLGNIPPNTPFLEAYKIAGDALVAANRVTPPSPSTGDPGQQKTGVAPQPSPTVLATRVAAPKPAASNGDKARAASPSPTTTKPATKKTNPLEMADSDFLKQFGDRL